MEEISWSYLVVVSRIRDRTYPAQTAEPGEISVVRMEFALVLSGQTSGFDNLPYFFPSRPLLRSLVGGLGPSHTAKTAWANASPGIVSLSLPPIVSRVPVEGT